MDKIKHKHYIHVWFISSIFIGLSLLSVIPVYAVSQTNTCAVHLTSVYNYNSDTLNGGYIKWTTDLCMDSLDYNLGSDSHISFTNVALGSVLNPSQSFGVAMTKGNATITAIDNRDISFDVICKTGVTCFLSYYITTSVTPSQTITIGGTKIPSVQWLSSAAALTTLPQPQVYWNQGQHYLEVSTYGDPLITFTNPPQCSPNIPSQLFNYLNLSYIIPTFLAITLIIGALFAAYSKSMFGGTYDTATAEDLDMDTSGTINYTNDITDKILAIVVISVLLIVMVYVVGTFAGQYNLQFGCAS